LSEAYPTSLADDLLEIGTPSMTLQPSMTRHTQAVAPVAPVSALPLQVPTGESASPPLPTWQRRYVLILVGLDTIGLMLGGLIGQLARFDTLAGSYRGVAYHYILLAAAPVWILTLSTARTYEARFLYLGSEEFRRVGNAAARFTALLAIVVFLFKWDIARGLVAGTLPAAAILTLTLRYLARRILYRVRQSGRASHRVIIVGDEPSRDVLSRRLLAAPQSGLRVVGQCLPFSTTDDGTRSVFHVRSAVLAAGADTIAVAHCREMDSGLLRQLAWSLEGMGVNLLVEPGLTEIAGPRVNIRPVSGLPLLQVAEPEFTGIRRLVKRTIDIFCAGAALLLGSPLLVAVALAVKMSTPGPALFRQVRLGKDGREFVIYKFRSMYSDAEERRREMLIHNDHGDGVLFKMREDPRITPAGRYLRRFSLDELPQLFNVLVGQMSLVGPRPPLPAEVARYEPDAHRRLLVRPGLTGLWQVSGRSDLSWTETVRLDLFYVENWSVALDAEIVWKTVGAVLSGSGAR
jgi:exopolysaccharide biosynthesis polyprenyl glycosylphosphotransferase